VATSKKPNALGGGVADPLDARAARRYALDALARRDHASAELRRKLLEKGYDAAVVVPLVDALRTEKLLDDRRYTENFVAYHAARGEGPKRVRAELRRRGLEGMQVEECLDAFPDWILHLRRAQQKKFGAVPPITPADKVRRVRFLGYRGFTSAQIRTALGFDIDIDSDTNET
jgi:regulatory protein